MGTKESTSPAGPFISVWVDSTLTRNVVDYIEVTADWGRRMAVLRQYSTYNDAIGGLIELHQDYSFCPVLTGRDGRPVFLFKLVEVLDELLDYSTIRDRLPGLSFRQISAAIAFLRKLAQFNLKGIDIDALIDSEEEADQELINNLRSALSTHGANVVLDMP